MFLLAYHAAFFKLLLSPLTKEVFQSTRQRLVCSRPFLLKVALAFKTLVLGLLWTGSLWFLAFALNALVAAVSP